MNTILFLKKNYNNPIVALATSSEFRREPSVLFKGYVNATLP